MGVYLQVDAAIAQDKIKIILSEWQAFRLLEIVAVKLRDRARDEEGLIRDERIALVFPVAKVGNDDKRR